MDPGERIQALEEENDELRERIRFLETQLMPEWTPPIEWGLTGKEGAVFQVLLGRERASKELIMMQVYCGSHDEPEIKIVDVFICKMRRKLKPFGIIIETIWGQGYRLSPECRKRLLTDVREPVQCAGS